MINVMMNARTIRRKLKGWMREPEWKWHIVHTDRHGDTVPKVRSECPVYKLDKAMGINPHISPNGPNKGAITNETI